jgi:hypothetical protein
VLALWAGALLTVGALVAPTLFRVLPERALAGLVAGELFTLLTWLSVPAAVAAWALRSAAPRGGRAWLAWRGWAFVPAVLLVANEYGVRVVMHGVREGEGGGVTPAFLAWHAVSAALYAVATLVVLALFWRELRR